MAPAAHVAEPGGAAPAGAFDRVRMVRELMRRRGGDPAAAAQLLQLCREFSPSEGAAAYEELARAHEAAGHVNLAAEARLMLAQSYPDEPLAQQAVLWLTRLYASSEVANRHRPAGQISAADADRGVAMYAYHVAGGIEQRGDARRADPALVFARAVAARRAGMAKAAGTLLASLKHAQSGNAWSECARVESWLADERRAAPPRLVVRCVRASAAPRLDGALDEACWSVAEASEDGAQPQAMGDAAVESAGRSAGDAAADVRWAYDAEYLYVAVRCAKREGVRYERDNRARVRDADLTGFDRVRLSLDVDRDYATCYELTIDSRGWTADAVWGDAGWDPQWFVAEDAAAEAASPGGGGPGAEAWCVEGAIAWGELGVAAPAAGTAWAVGVERLLPLSGGAQPQATGDAGASARPGSGGRFGQGRLGPEGFGVLVFE